MERYQDKQVDLIFEYTTKKYPTKHKKRQCWKNNSNTVDFVMG